MVALVLVAASARALDTGDVNGRPIHLDVTEAASVLYNVDNRNTVPSSVVRLIDDDWGVYYNRLNAQASYGRFQVGLRLDSAWFFASKEPVEVGLDLLRERHGGALPATYSRKDAAYFVQKTTEASRELSTRYTSWIYPAKYWVSYASPDLDATVGDFYAQFGRGLVLSVRKQDELASDTTIRGARATARLRADSVRFRLTALGGVLNPLRFDESSGRYLGVTPAVTSGLASVTEAGMPRAQASPFDASASPTFAPDRVVGVELEGGTKLVTVGVHGSLLGRSLPTDANGVPTPLSPGVVRSADSVRTGSVSLSLPDLGGHGALYAEAALQGLSYPAELERTSSSLPPAGHALYGSASVFFSPVTFTAEGKHYRRFFPLLANVDLAHAPEFSAVQYSAPPTTEALWVDTEFEGFNTCVTGGRLKGDLAVAKRASVFVWAGRYASWAESVANERCDVSGAAENRVWDLATGAELGSNDGRSRATVTAGVRLDDADRLLVDPNGGETHVYYREAYVRHDVVHPLGADFTAKLQGYGRRRHQTQSGVAAPWTEIQETFAVDFRAKLVVGTGFEYIGNPQFSPTYFNGFVSYNVTSSSSVSLFAGQRRGGLRCVSGVCRVYPPFEGVRLDATIRF
ncbi:MAG TPA: DUF6029 family protein [Polyangiaceae bacterium]|nr:DUF6029 family protein [Polyangiaceae bacterium]